MVNALFKWLDFLNEHPILKNADTAICIIGLVIAAMVIVVLCAKSQKSFFKLFF
jgi:hypothetical protein